MRISPTAALLSLNILIYDSFILIIALALLQKKRLLFTFIVDFFFPLFLELIYTGTLGDKRKSLKRWSDILLVKCANSKCH